MCIICVSPAGIRQPSLNQIKTMFSHNMHGAGYMVAHNGRVHIHKGYMDADSFAAAIEAEHFTASDSVVYHFRVSTQAGVSPEMTHPFPLSDQLSAMKALHVACACGIVHNGTIQLTYDPQQHEYSDTALFITRYMAKMLHGTKDIRDAEMIRHLQRLTDSKLAIMDGSGYIATVGNFIEEQGLLFSNDSYTKEFSTEKKDRPDCRVCFRQSGEIPA